MDWLFVADLVRESFNQVNELLLFLLLLGTTLSIELSLSEKQATQSLHKFKSYPEELSYFYCYIMQINGENQCQTIF